MKEGSSGEFGGGLVVNEEEEGRRSPGEDTLLHTPEKSRLSPFHLFALTVNFCGIFFAYSLQGVVIVPLFQSLGLTGSQTSLVMLISPIAVIIGNPIVGVMSDNCTSRFGRRRLFMLLGLLIQVLGLFLLAIAPDLGYWLGDPLPTADASGNVPVMIWAVMIGVVGFSCVDFAAGVMQLPSRALLMDISPLSQQGMGAALFAFWMSAGNALGYLSGSVDWNQWTFFQTIFSSKACPPGSCVNFRVLFLFATVLDIITMAMSILSTSETPLVKEPSGKSGVRKCMGDVLQVFTDTWDYIAHRADRRTTRTLIVYFVCWLSWPLWTFYISNWVGVEVYGGNPSAPEGTPEREDYDDGVELASFALFLYSIVAFVYSLMIPWVVKIPFLGYRSAWAGAMILHGFIYFALIAFRNKVLTVILISAAGINLASLHTVPWVFLAWSTAPEDNGIASAVMNVYGAIPSLFLNGLINPGLQYIFDSPVPAMCFGGLIMFIAGLMVFLIARPTEEELKKQK